jgi:nucleoside-diphosphate-sugar epimerase
MANPILVTGAAGRVGAVGRTVTELLLKQGKSVRAMVGPWRDGLLQRGLPVHVVDLATMADLHRVGRYDRMSGDVLTLTGASTTERAGVHQEECDGIYRVGKSGLSVCAPCIRQIQLSI